MIPTMRDGWYLWAEFDMHPIVLQVRSGRAYWHMLLGRTVSVPVEQCCRGRFVPIPGW